MAVGPVSSLSNPTPTPAQQGERAAAVATERRGEEARLEVERQSSVQAAQQAQEAQAEQGIGQRLNTQA